MQQKNTKLINNFNFFLISTFSFAVKKVQKHLNIQKVIFINNLHELLHFFSMQIESKDFSYELISIFQIKYFFNVTNINIFLEFTKSINYSIDVFMELLKFQLTAILQHKTFIRQSIYSFNNLNFEFRKTQSICHYI